MTKRLGWVGGLAILLLSLGCRDKAEPAPGDSATTTPEALRVGIAIPSYVHAIAWIAEDEKHFHDRNIEPTVSVMGGSAATMRTLLADEIDIGLAGGDAVLKANRAGADLVIVGIFVDKFYHRLIARKGIESKDDLRGKKVGLPFLGGPQDMAAKVALKELGLDYANDVEVLSLGKEFNRMAALSAGEIDATMSQTPSSHLEQLGFHVLVDLPKTDEAFPYVVVAVRRETLQSRRPLIVRGVAALCQATKFYKNGGNKARAIAIIEGHITGSDTEGNVDERYDATGPTLLALPPSVEPTSMKNVAELTGKAGEDTSVPADLIDASIVKELIASGDCAP